VPSDTHPHPTLSVQPSARVQVDPAFQGQGLGSASLFALLAAGARRRVPLSYNLEVRAGNAAALRLYAAFGFDAAGRRKGYYAAPREDAVVMTRGAVSAEELDAWRARAARRGVRLAG